MKILIVSDAWHPQVNGVVRTYEYLSRELGIMGYTVSVIGPADFPQSYPMPGYSEISLVLFPYNLLRRMIMEFDPDILHIATEGPLGIAARKYALAYGVEFTSCYHTHFPEYAAKRAGKYLPFLEPIVRRVAIDYVRWFHSASSCLFAATPSLETTLREWDFKCPIKRMTRGIDHSLFKLGEKTLFHGMPHPIALYVGRVAMEKNLEDFLGMDWRGSKVIVGDGPDLKMLKEKYPNAHFVGVKKEQELADHYRSADVFVFPSKTDTFGMVLVEAMACGLPIAAYPVTGPVDIITNTTLGVLGNDLSIAASNALDNGTPAERALYAAQNFNWRRATAQFLETD